MTEDLHSSTFAQYLRVLKEREEAGGGEHNPVGRRESDEALWHLCQSLDAKQMAMKRDLEETKAKISELKARVVKNHWIIQLLLYLVLGAQGAKYFVGG